MQYRNNLAYRWEETIWVTLLYARCPSTTAKKNKSACFWDRFPLRLRWCYTGRFVTTIFNATQHYNIVATLFRMVATLFKTATLCCDENRRCKSSLCNITLIDPGHALQSLFRATENSSKGDKQVYNRASLIGQTSIAKREAEACIRKAEIDSTIQSASKENVF